MTIRHARKCKHQIQSMPCMKPWETTSFDTCMCQGVPGRARAYVCEPHSALRLRSPTNIGHSATHREYVEIVLHAPVYHSTVTCRSVLRSTEKCIEHRWGAPGAPGAPGALGAPGAPWAIDPGLHGPLDGLQHGCGDLAQFMFQTCLDPFVIL